LAQRGVHVALSGRRRERLQEVAARATEHGVQAAVVECDVRDEARVAQAVRETVERLGRLDIALANAGFTVGGRVEELSGEDWRRQLETNVVGVAMTARHAIPELRITRGRLALIGSVAGFMPAPGFAAYHASKHAVRALGQTLSLELASSGVSCTTVHPGFVASEINQVDNRGRFDPVREDRRPAYLMWSAERAARVIIDAMTRRRRELVFTGHGKLAAFVGMHFPGVFQFVMTRGPMREQATSFRVE
jgi:NAD(P)-dependent dehydrogenase (short-subunit alcohol dehydrogenase family)